MPDKKQKSEVQYGPGHTGSRCGVCRYFIAVDHKCQKVVGTIGPWKWCELFKKKDK